MRQARSPLLRAHKPPARLDIGGLPRRRFWTILVAVAISLPAIVVWFRLAPIDGWGYPFYWVHDKMVLPFIGYSFTCWHPFSWIGWGVVFCLGCMALWTYLTLFSFVKFPQEKLTRYTVTERILMPFLIKATALFKKLGAYPTQLLTITSLYRGKSLLALRMLPLEKKGDSLIKQVVGRTRDHIELLCLGSRKHKSRVHDDHLTAVLIWHEAFTQVCARRRRQPDRKLLIKCEAVLAADLAAIIDPLWDFRDRTERTEIAAREADFSLKSLLLDLLYLAAPSNSSLAALLFPATASGPHLLAQDHLAASTRARQTYLEQRFHQLEALLTIQQQPDNDPSTFSNETTLLSRLALGIALDLADMSCHSEHGLAYMDALESLALALDCDSTNRFNGCRPHCFQLPAPEHYRFIAEVAWQQQPFSIEPHLEGVIRADDLYVGHTRVRDLFLAAGPQLGRYDLFQKERLE